MRYVTLAVLAGAALSACSVSVRKSSPNTSSATPAAADTTVQGQLRATGSVPMVRMVLDADGGRFVMSGSLASEMANLQGATVQVRGAVGLVSSLPPARSIEVHEYTIVAVGGEKPYVGTLMSRDGGWWLAGSDTLQLTGVPGDFPARAGDKIYVVGDRSGGTLNVRAYGVLRRGGM